MQSETKIEIVFGLCSFNIFSNICIKSVFFLFPPAAANELGVKSLIKDLRFPLYGIISELI